MLRSFPAAALPHAARSLPKLSCALRMVTGSALARARRPPSCASRCMAARVVTSPKKQLLAHAGRMRGYGARGRRDPFARAEAALDAVQRAVRSARRRSAIQRGHRRVLDRNRKPRARCIDHERRGSRGGRRVRAAAVSSSDCDRARGDGGGSSCSLRGGRRSALCGKSRFFARRSPRDDHRCHCASDSRA